MDWPSHLINVVGHKLASSCYALAQPLTTLENISFVEIFFKTRQLLLKCRCNHVKAEISKDCNLILFSLSNL